MSISHEQCLKHVVQFLAREASIAAYAMETPDHECSWWKEHICPHRITFFTHPTKEQLQEWKENPVGHGGDSPAPA